MRIFSFSDRIQFVTSMSVTEAVAALSKETRPFAADILFNRTIDTPAMIGEVSEDYVRLRMLSPMVRNSFRPFFYGSFKRRGNGAVLEGTYTTSLMTRIMMAVFFVFAIAMGVTSYLSAPSDPTPVFFFPFFLAWMVVVFVTGRWWSAKEVEQIGQIIRMTLNVK